MRCRNEMYPDFSAEIEYIDEKGVDTYVIGKIIEKHLPNSSYNKKLYDRYNGIREGVPIFARSPRFEDAEDIINNKINNDFFSEIIDFKTGYFAGVPIAYSYSDTAEAVEGTGDAGDTLSEAEVARDQASKTLSDFVTLNNMFDVDMEVTKYASICGYSARLLYYDDGIERVMPIAPFETAILSETDITEPKYAVRYYKTTDINGTEHYEVVFYSADREIHYSGTDYSNLSEKQTEEGRDLNLYGMCPLQGIPNNAELIGDAEKVLELIDAYDRNISDANNDIEAFANAYMVIENTNLDDEDIKKAQHNGIIQVDTGTYNGKVYFLTKDMTDTFLSNQIKRIESNVYKFSKTPNLSDENFGNASGSALRFRLTGLEAKCGMFQAKMMSAGRYMFKALSQSWAKKTIKVDPLQIVMEFSRNFPLDLLGEAQAVAQLISTGGISKRTAISQLSFIDDPDYELELVEREKQAMPSLMDRFKEDGDDEAEITEQNAESPKQNTKNTEQGDE